jgi:hypothetical protein
MKRSVLKPFARPAVRLVVLPAFLLALASVSHAQAAGSAAHPTTKAAAPTATPAMAPLTAQTGQSSSPVERKPGGNHEGIQVHGQWVIEVKNPDGTVTARREFENSIQQSGMSFLASLIAGNNSSGNLSIMLNGASASFVTLFGVSFSSSQAGPCLPMSTATYSSGGLATGTTCLLTAGPSSTGLLTYYGLLCSAYQEAYLNGKTPPAGQTFPCSTNLTVSGPEWSDGTASTFTGTGVAQVQIIGSVTATATAGGNVSDVETVFFTCAGNVSPGTCVANGTLQGGLTATPAGYGLFTERNLDGNTTAGAAAGDPMPVPYSPGQMISVSVTISFQ